MYPSYEDAHARERELLLSARRSTIGAKPGRERRSIFQPSRLLALVRERYADAASSASPSRTYRVAPTER